MPYFERHPFTGLLFSGVLFSLLLFQHPASGTAFRGGPIGPQEKGATWHFVVGRRLASRKFALTFSAEQSN